MATRQNLPVADGHNFLFKAYGVPFKFVSSKGTPLHVATAFLSLLRRSAGAVKSYGGCQQLVVVFDAQEKTSNHDLSFDHKANRKLGNLTSQIFANIYLNELDRFVKHTLRAKRYIRYTDDFVIVQHDPALLANYKSAIEQFLADILKLALHPIKWKSGNTARTSTSRIRDAAARSRNPHRHQASHPQKASREAREVARWLAF